MYLIFIKLFISLSINIGIVFSRRHAALKDFLVFEVNAWWPGKTLLCV